ncbi:MAG: hypothetical protein CMF63_09020 [Magnetovibrio sp.]|nr:hypothetical protein [Magnetovibrio sp.]
MQRLAGTFEPLIRIEPGIAKGIFYFAFNSFDMELFNIEMALEESQIKFRAPMRALVAFIEGFKPENQFFPEIVVLCFGALVDSETGPSLDGKAGAGADIPVNAAVRVVESFEKGMCCRASEIPVA